MATPYPTPEPRRQAGESPNRSRGSSWGRGRPRRPRGGRAIGLNETGSFIWPLIERECEAGIVRAVVRRFRVDAEVARAEIARFVDLLSARGLIVARETSPAESGPSRSDAGIPGGGAA